jgi:hypothetical protein
MPTYKKKLVGTAPDFQQKPEKPGKHGMVYFKL